VNEKKQQVQKYASVVVNILKTIKIDLCATKICKNKKSNYIYLKIQYYFAISSFNN